MYTRVAPSVTHLTTNSQDRGPTHTAGCFFFFFIFSFLSFFKQYLRISLMQSKNNKMSIFCFCFIYEQFSPQALKDSLKELKESSSLSSFKTHLKAA